MNVRQMVDERDAKIFAEFKTYDAKMYRIDYIHKLLGEAHGISSHTVKNILKRQRKIKARESNEQSL